MKLSTSVVACVAIAVVPFLLGIATAQSVRSFEVASIRLVSRSGDGPILGPGKAGPPPPTAPPPAQGQLTDTFSFSGTAYIMLLRAFEFQVCAEALRGEECPRLIGGPDWIRKDTYAIRAKLPAGTAGYTEFQFSSGKAPEINAMLLTLFQERFALTTHRETKEQPAFALSVSRGGQRPKLTQGKMVTRADGTEQLLTRPVAIGVFTAPNGVPMVRMTVVNQSMQEIAQGLSFFLNRSVVDRTGLSGKFDFEMEYEADRDSPSPGDQMRGPAMYTAFQEQAGLRLESIRAPIEVIVVDSIQRPSEN